MHFKLSNEMKCVRKMSLKVIVILTKVQIFSGRFPYRRVKWMYFWSRDEGLYLYSCVVSKLKTERLWPSNAYYADADDATSPQAYDKCSKLYI